MTPGSAAGIGSAGGGVAMAVVSVVVVVEVVDSLLPPQEARLIARTPAARKLRVYFFMVLM